MNIVAAHMLDNWMWYAPLIFWIVYEAYAFITRIPGYTGRRVPTLSQRVWWGYDRFEYLPHIVAAVFGVLFWHFFVDRKRKPPV